MDKLRHCVDQFGKIGEVYFDKAVFLGTMCLFPNFCQEPSTYEVIRNFVDNLNSQYQSWDSGLGDLKVFAKRRGYRSFDKGYIRTRDVVNLCEFGKSLYPEVGNILDTDYWDELAIYRRAECLSQDAFEKWINSYLRNKLNFDAFFDTIIQRLFPNSNHQITFYSLVDDGNSNTAFAPYILIGDSCILTIAQRWVL
ncbi:hypothetical protein DSM106972_047450 [Dulcicalothrix desertica PCC 7102]|uniref:Uncharacterized protein n=1 Tax=Dulcicalothrix desertica PCC 7102 TaxID=232991 RepID=A0A433VCJ1_9CYAN|nr:hypothetical protein [Dulcicalothrix desertica]RUT03831.1 hypothetical protein DSM106972_047450 [Dulcicalothrix desertica PCC 7102]TWH43760.1 hypothetical protein CAL7102_07504 [Dulcicalothrix desertica PCC 7102]